MTMFEQTLIVGAENHLVATLASSSRSHDGRSRCVAILSNSGVIPRTGPHRMNVHLARRFAEMGIPSVRFDMTGLGDSRRSSSTLPIVRQWVADTRSVMDVAQSRFECDQFFMVGFCSGAEVAHFVALEDARMRGIVLWDLYAYPTIESRVRTTIFRLRRAGLAGIPNKIVARLNYRLRALVASQTTDHDSAEKLSTVPHKHEFAARIQRLVDSDVKLLFAYCGGEPDWYNHAGQFRRMFAGHPFVREVAVGYLAKSDHLITQKVAQVAFVQMVEEWLESRFLNSLPSTD